MWKCVMCETKNEDVSDCCFICQSTKIYTMRYIDRMNERIKKEKNESEVINDCKGYKSQITSADEKRYDTPIDKTKDTFSRSMSSSDCMKSARTESPIKPYSDFRDLDKIDERKKRESKDSFWSPLIFKKGDSISTIIKRLIIWYMLLNATFMVVFSIVLALCQN